MKKNKLDEHYWDFRYQTNSIGWNIGYTATPIKTYIDQLNDKSVKILIPGAGNGYEAEYLWNNGFKNIFALDIAKTPLLNLKSRVPDFPDAQLLHMNFFDLNITFDLVLEQTFFCALNPILRPKYAQKMHKILGFKGKLVGLLFDFELTQQGPPFGGTRNEYQNLFNLLFNVKVLERSFNSIKPRDGKELFFIFEKLKEVQD